MMDLSIVLPAYQEADNLRTLLPKLNYSLESMNIRWETIVVDTMTPLDETPAICEAHHASCIARTGGNNYGDAIRTGIQVAQGRRILLMDADGSHDPKYIDSLYQKACDGTDVVIGSRYTKGGGTHNGFILRMMSYAVNVAYRVLFHLKIKDISDSFRVYDAHKLKSVVLNCDDFDIVEEILIRLKLQYPKLTVEEVPIYFDKRMCGESKRDLFRFILSYAVTIRRLKRIIKATPSESAQTTGHGEDRTI